VLGVFLCGLPITIAHQNGAALSLALAWTFAIALVFACALLALSLRLPSRN
jgi:hypothetical protein